MRNTVLSLTGVFFEICLFAGAAVAVGYGALTLL